MRHYNNWWYFVPFATIGVTYLMYYLEDRMYRRIEKKVKLTAVVCPGGNRMRDFELAYGHCIKCATESTCQAKLLEEWLKSQEEQKPPTNE